MPKIKWLNERSVWVKGAENQLTLEKNATGAIDATVGQATVGAKSTTERVAASPIPNVSKEWIVNALQDAGCSEAEIEKVLDWANEEEFPTEN